MGQKNSSITRVWPVFDFLLEKDDTGRSWLPQLLQLSGSGFPNSSPGPLLRCVAQRQRELPAAIRRELKPEAIRRIGRIRNAFEKDIPPAEGFLRWLIEHPKCLKWPDGPAGPLTYGEGTQQRRERLMHGDLSAKQEALAELDIHGSVGSRRRWWAFEGYTSVDCWLETESFMLLIEGKRTEQIAPSTSWFPKRNQIVRNVEVAAALAGDKDFAVMLCAETQSPLPQSCWDDSLPHLGRDQRRKLQSHYLGCVLWKDIVDALCPGLLLPDTVVEATA